MKTVFVTGATGFLGSHVVGQLLETGLHVLAAMRPSSDLQRLAPYRPSIKLVDVESGQLRRTLQAAGKIDAIIHTATCYGRDQEPVEQLLRSNLLFPVALLESAMALEIGTFINTGTILHPSLSTYALSKHQFSQWGRYSGEKGRIAFFELRVDQIYGPGDDTSKFVARVVNDCRGNVAVLPLTAGEQERDFIYIDDLAASFIAILQSGSSEPGFHSFDVGTGSAVRVREVVEMIHRLTNSRTRLDFGALPYREHETMYWKADLGGLSRLGWRARVPLAEGIRRTVAAACEAFV